MKHLFCAVAVMLFCVATMSAKDYVVKSPNGKVQVTLGVDKAITYALSFDGQELIAPSEISMQITEGKKAFSPLKMKSAKPTKNEGTIDAVVYKKAKVDDNYNGLKVDFKEGFGLEVRAYDEGAAYRFTTTRKADYTVDSEKATFNFSKDWVSYYPYTRESAKGSIEKQFGTSFENTYTHDKLSKMDPTRLVFAPFIVEADNNVKMSITEADFEDYPGMYVRNEQGGKVLNGVFAPYPKRVEQGGHNKLQLLVKERENYLVKGTKGQRNFPWRVICLSDEDKQMADNDMVYRLASPQRVSDVSWIKPGKVAWEWWNCWGVYNVPFKTGVNNETYKAYIDFASKYGVEYVILDEGWAVNLQADLFQIVPEINLKELVDYGKQKNVGIILWAGYYAFERDMEKVCKHYSEMGVKGFKVDFMDRDDAALVDFLYRSAAMAAKYKLVLDFHGIFKPTGLSRTYPNVLNYEGVAGLEQCKWSKLEEYDHVSYDVILPFGRMLAGPMDYTQGAMLNGSKTTYRPNNTEPMSQGTRCHQLAQYAVFFSPLNMLCDSPTHYEKEAECAKFIAGVPCVWDETVALESKIGEYVTIARRSGNTWYIGSITNWDGRQLTIDASKLGIGGKTAEVFRDGPNVGKVPSDYVHETVTVPADGKLNITMGHGGGYIIKVTK